MELTVNLFFKGLQIDTHPMVLDNNTLSDALNATFVTMNENEVILQNDMGNRRIDNAFLPSGYQPLGMKEYGGVIYVAAYNPLTNRGLIGSFPSPLRKINIDKNKGGRLNFGDFILYEENKDTAKMYGKIKTEYIIIPISENIVLHTGDKFSIYSDEINLTLPYLTLPEDNKNKLFTFLIGVFNSLNEFVDITDKLKIWDNKYFINVESGVSNETIADNDLIRARNRMAINTYSLKMASPLYLKAIINHIENVSYSIYGEYIGTSKVKLEIEVTYYYNCIDDVNGEKFKIYFNGNELSSLEHPKAFGVQGEFGQYYTTLTYCEEINLNEVEDKTNYEYEIKFPLLHNYEEWVYPIFIDSLTKTGSLDLTKLASDSIVFKGYRYYNNLSTKTTTLEISIESYPKNKNSKLYFQTLLTGSDKLEIIKEIYKPGSGVLVILFNWEDFTLVERELYYLNFFQLLKENDLEEGKQLLCDKSLYITTGIFNGNYIGEKTLSKEEWENYYYIKDNKKYIDYSYDDLYNIYIKDFSEIKKLKLTPKLKCSVNSNISEPFLTTTGNYLYPKNSTETSGKYITQESWKIDNIISISSEISNIEVYPKNVDNILSIKNSNNVSNFLSIKILEVKRKLDNENIYPNSVGSSIYTYQEGLLSILNGDIQTDSTKDIIRIENIVNNNLATYNNLKLLKLTSDIHVKNILEGNLVDKTIYCNHVIIPFSRFIKDYYYGNNLGGYITLRAPYIQIDSESTSYFSIAHTDKLEQVYSDLSATVPNEMQLLINGKVGGDGENKGAYVDEIARDSISNYLNDNCKENFLVGEHTFEDYIFGFEPCVKCSPTSQTIILPPPFSSRISLLNPAKNIKRIWMKINKREYIPIFTITGSNDLLDFYKDDGMYENIFSKIPHCYEYEPGGKNLQEKIIGTYYNRTKEFELNSNLIVKIGGNITLKDSTELYSLKYDYITDNIEFNEGKIHSNENFEEDIKNMLDATISCAIMDGDYDNHTLYIKDVEGNDIDPLFVYYDDSEERNASTKAFKKSYIAEKFYVPELDLYLPEIKSSRKLYRGKKGDHELINEYVYPYKVLRQLIISDNGNNVPPDKDREVGEGSWDKTYILWEGTDNRKDSQMPIRVKNIFNRNTILKYGLVYKENTTGSVPMANGWEDWD